MQVPDCRWRCEDREDPRGHGHLRRAPRLQARRQPSTGAGHLQGAIAYTMR